MRGYRLACRHLMALGLRPVPCLPELQALRADSCEDRELAREAVSRWEIAI